MMGVNMEERLFICIDGENLCIKFGESIYQALEKLNLDRNSISTIPLAALIDGKMFDLHYAPVTECDIKLVRFDSEAGRRVYERSLKYIVLYVIKQLYEDVELIEQHSLGNGIYIAAEFPNGKKLGQDDEGKIKAECKKLIGKNLRFVRTQMDSAAAIEFFKKTGQCDRAKLLSQAESDDFEFYSIEGSDYLDYLYGVLVPSTGYISVFDIKCVDDAVLIMMPSAMNPNIPNEYSRLPKLEEVFMQSDNWCRLMHCSTANDLNSLVERGELPELIRVNEALHERAYAKLADEIAARGARAVLIGGPSSSGKTTSANRIATQLRALGLSPIMLSLDNYYLDRDKMIPDENGEIDVEHINALDIERIGTDLSLLMAGEAVETPVFSFAKGKREEKGVILQGGKEHPIIIEGIHALNPLLLSDVINKEQVYKVYVSAMTTLNLDNHNRIRTSDVRLLRRLVRDFATRSASMDRTLSMWQGVQRGERLWVFPFQEEADTILNTALVYELAVLKKYAYGLLADVKPSSPYYAAARELVRFLTYFVDADASVEAHIPPTSILREFIGGNSFYEIHF
jgi:uridine kinase